jgi:hypothetical protein
MVFSQRGGKLSPDDLKGKFHAHLTLKTDCIVVNLRGWKMTIITMNKEDRHLTDFMFTRHFLLGSEKTPTLEAIKAEIEASVKEIDGGLGEVTRVKLEHESLPTLPPSETNYRECHIKIRVPKGHALETIDGFVQSRNPMDEEKTHSTIFLNARFYSGTVEEVDAKADEAVNCIRLLNPNCEILEVKKESTVFDTNHDHDKWWA